MTDYCRIVQDLWPLYVEDDLSEESKVFIEEHIQSCPACGQLSENAVDLHQILSVPPVNPGSAEGFVLRLRRKIRITAVTALTIGLVVLIGVWYFTGTQASRAHRQEMDQEKTYFQEQLVALEEVSPPPEQLLNRLGLGFKITKAVKSEDQVKIEYALRWQADSEVEWVTTDRNWFDDSLLVDAAGGQPLQMISSGGSSSRREFNGHIEAKPGALGGSKVVMKTRTLYAFAKPEQDIRMRFDYAGGEADILIDRQFSYRGVDFIVDNLHLNDEEFVVKYRQLTPATEAGVWVLNFAFDDLLGNSWQNDPEAELAAINPKQFSIRALQSPAKKWEVRVNHVVQVIPGIKSEVDLEGGGGA